MAASYIHDGTAHRKVKQWHVHDGTAWRKAKKGYCHDGTAWRLVFTAREKLMVGSAGNINGRPTAIRYLDGNLYVIGESTVNNRYIAKWDGSTWSQPFGTGGSSLREGDGIEFYASDFYVSKAGGLFKITGTTYTTILAAYLFGTNLLTFSGELVWGGYGFIASYNGTTVSTRMDTFALGYGSPEDLITDGTNLFALIAVSGVTQVFSLTTSWTATQLGTLGASASYFTLHGGEIHAVVATSPRTIQKWNGSSWSTVATCASDVFPAGLVSNAGDLFAPCYDSTAAEYDLYQVSGSSVVATAEFADLAAFTASADNGTLYVAEDDGDTPGWGDLYSY